MPDPTSEPDTHFPASRARTIQVRVGDLAIGGDAPISVQSMAKCPTHDVAQVLEQTRRVAAAGGQVMRVAVPDQRAADALPAILAESPLPVVADVHFDWRLAVAAVEAGVHKLRINPGNIGDRDVVARVVRACVDYGIPLRVGVNAGSLERDLLARHGGPTAEALAESALRNADLVRELGLEQVVVSLKAADVPRTVRANRLFARRCDLPLHLGITEAGLADEGMVKSALGLGVLLAEGLGDTVRVSLTGPPEQEVRVARLILRSLGLQPGPVLVSCPTCGRRQIDVEDLAREVAQLLAGVEEPIVVAVMGCEVNGPGEACEADLGVAGGRERAVIFRHGRVVRTVPSAEALPALREELADLLGRHGEQPSG